MMIDSTNTQSYFLLGLIAALVLVPVLALAATTSPASVQDGATFNASAGPEVTAGEDMAVATHNVFPDAETVRLGPVTVAHAGQLKTNLTGADGSLPTIKPQASSPSDLTLAHDNTSLSATVAGGSIDSLALSDSATVGDSADDIELDTGGTGTTLTVSGLTGSQVTFIDSSGSQNQELATKSVSSGTASLSVSANVQREILLATSPPGFDVSIDSTNSSIVEGQTLTVTANINNTGGAQGTQTVTLDAGGLGTNSTSVTLASGASQTVTLSLATSTGDDGTYAASVASDDDSDSAQVEVLENVPNFRVNVTNSNAPIDPGGTLSFDIAVENIGAKADTQGIVVESGGAVIETTPTTLASGESTTIPVSIDSSQTAIGATATVSSDNESEGFVARESTWSEVNRQDTGSHGPVAISPDGSLVAHANASNVIVYETQSETPVQNISVASSGISALDWHPDGDRLAIGTSGNKLRVYDQAANTLLNTINYGGTVRDVEWSPGGDKLLAAAGSTAYVLDGGSLGELRSESSTGGGLGAVAWSGDAQRFAVGGQRVQVFEVGGGRILNVPTSESNNFRIDDVTARGLAFARDGTRLVSIQQDSCSPIDSGCPITNAQVALYNIGTGNVLDTSSAGNFDIDDPGNDNADAVADPTDDRVAVATALTPTRVYTISGGSLTRTDSFAGRTGSADWAHSGEYIADSAGASLSSGGKGDTWRVHSSLPVVDGTVTDSNGNPITNATVSLAQAGAGLGSVPVENNGAYTLVAPEPGTYTVTASFTGSSSAAIGTKDVSVPTGGTTVSFTVSVVGQGIAGQIVDTAGNPISDSTIKIIGQSVKQDTSANGEFVLDTRDGNVDLRADAPGYGREVAVVDVPNGSVADVTIQLEQQTGFSISGTVTDPDGDPISGASVFAGAAAATTGPAGGYALAVDTGGLTTVTASTAVDSATQTANVTGGASGVDFTLATDAGGGQPASGNLEIRFETDGALVNNRTVTVGFFDDSQERFAERQTDTGIVDLGTLNETGPIVAVAEAPGLFTRRIIIDDLSADSIVFLLDDDKANSTIVVNEFDIVDNTGRFSGPDTRFRIKRAMPLPGETDDVPLRILGEDLLGADEQFGIALESDVRYRIVVENGEGDVRDLGPHFAVSGGRVTIEIGGVRFNVPDGDTFSVDATAEQTGNNSERVVFSYIDPEHLTGQVSVKIYNQSNESQVIHDQTHAPTSGTYGNLTITEIVTGTATGSNWVVEYTAERNETQSGTITVTATPDQLDIPIDQGIQQLLGVGLIIVVSGLFSARNAAVGAIVVPALAGTLWLVGVLSGVVSGAAIGLAFAVGVSYQLATGGPQ